MLYEYSYDESTLDYDLYMAESDLIRSLALLDNKAKFVTEAAQYTVLNEALKDVISEYINKVSASVTKAWNNFKVKMGDKAIQDFLEKNKGKIENGDFAGIKVGPDVLIPDYKAWADIKTESEFKDFTEANFNSWKDSNILETPEAYIKSQFSRLIENGGDKKPADIMHEKVFPKHQEQVLVSEQITPHAQWLKDSAKQINDISKTIDAINTANKNAKEMISKLNESNCYVGDRIFDILREDDEPNTQNSASTSTDAGGSSNNASETSSTNNQKVEGNQIKAVDDGKGGKSKDRTYLVNYYKANIQVFSAELKTCNQIRGAAFRLVKSFVNTQGGGTTKEKEQNTETTPETTGGADQIPK